MKIRLLMLLAAAGLIFSPGCTDSDNNDKYSDMLKDYGQDYDPSTEEPEEPENPDGPDGSAEKPYQLKTATDVQNMSKRLVARKTIHFELAADVDMAGIDWTPLNSGDGFHFWIHFDGKGHIIKNLTCRDKAYAGFFGVLCGDCINTGFVNADIKSTNRGGVIGGYMGIASPSTKDYTGRVENCYFTGKVAGDSGGGIVSCLGTSKDGLNCYIRNCYSTVEVVVTTSANRSGGLVADMNADAQILNSYSVGSVNTTGGIAGGIAGNVTGDGADISNCVARNFRLTASGGAPARIAVGWNSGLGQNCWAWDEMELYQGVNKVTASDNVAGAPYQGTAKTTAFISDMDNYTTWDKSVWHSETVNSGYPILKWQYERGDYAELGGHSDYTPPEEPDVPDGSGIASDPYILTNTEHMKLMRSMLVEDNLVYFELGADIDMGSIENWAPLNPAGPYKKMTHFDGKGHVIKNFTSKNHNYAGFFGVLVGTCKNVGFVDANIENTTTQSCGVLGGYLGTGDLHGTIENCYVTGKVTANNMAGGLIARIGSNDSYIKNCYSTVDVTVTEGSTEGGAGLVAWIRRGAMENCYAAGIVKAANGKAGGLVYQMGEGTNPSSLTNCVAWGSVTATDAVPGRIAGTWTTGTVSDNWAYKGMTVFNGENEITGVADSSTPVAGTPFHGVGKSLIFLSNMGNYTEWDTTDIWHNQTVNGGYPILKWQFARGDYAALAGHSTPAPEPNPEPNSPGGSLEGMDNWNEW